MEERRGGLWHVGWRRARACSGVTRGGEGLSIGLRKGTRSEEVEQEDVEARRRWACEGMLGGGVRRERIEAWRRGRGVGVRRSEEERVC